MIARMIELLGRTLGEHVEIRTRLAPDLWTARADPSQLENVILNLAVNARDAMPDGGSLILGTSNILIADDLAQELDLESGDYVLISVTDSGSGMSPEVTEKAFDPFFTTKEVGKGSGLGLSQVFGFVRQSGGHVKIRSGIGEGTTINVYLPRYRGEEKPVVSKGVQGSCPRGSHSEIIMVVEDEERVRNFSVEALRELGYTVVHAAHGAEAMKLMERGLDVTLLFTDVVMPGMTGRELAAGALKLLPDLKLLYTTGYAKGAVVHKGILAPGTRLLQKPFSIEQLAISVREVLDA
jgi:CheY-like chemotaxis protein